MKALNLKEHAEAILERLEIPVSVFIDMTYRQVILRDGVPFSLDIPNNLITRDSLLKEEFDTMMQSGLMQARQGESIPVEDAYNPLSS